MFLILKYSVYIALELNKYKPPKTIFKCSIISEINELFTPKIYDF